MVRVRNKGVIVPRHAVGLQRAVRGELLLRDELRPDLNRSSRTAMFLVNCEHQVVIRLFDAQLMHVTEQMMVLSGFESDYNASGALPADYAQTWVLSHVEGAEALGSLGPPYLK